MNIKTKEKGRWLPIKEIEKNFDKTYLHHCKEYCISFDKKEYTKDKKDFFEYLTRKNSRLIKEAIDDALEKLTGNKYKTRLIVSDDKTLNYQIKV